MAWKDLGSNALALLSKTKEARKVLSVGEMPVRLKALILFVAFIALFSSGIRAEESAMPTLHRGINLSSWFANAPRQPLSTSDFQEIKKLGFDFVRLPVNPETIGFSFDLTDEQLGALKFRDVDAAIDGLIKQGLTVVFDVHPEAEFMERLETDARAEKRFIALWKALSAHYKRLPNAQLVYGLLNEPQYYKKTQRYNNFIAEVVNVIRAEEPNRLLVVNTSGNMSPKPVDALRALKIFDDPKVLYDVHTYQPYIVTHQGMDSGFEKEQIRYFRNVPYPSSLVDKDKVRASLAPGANLRKAMNEVDAYVEAAWNKDRIKEYLAPVAAWAKEKNVRVLVLEFGALRKHADPQSRYRWIEDMRSVLDDLGLGWALWDYTDGFGIMRLIGDTKIDRDGTVRFDDLSNPQNRRQIDPEALRALGLPSPAPSPQPQKVE